jgi:hypothetical protein
MEPTTEPTEEPIVVYARFLGHPRDAWHAGISARDLSREDYDALTVEQRRLVQESPLYESPEDPDLPPLAEPVATDAAVTPTPPLLPVTDVAATPAPDDSAPNTPEPDPVDEGPEHVAF